jgi:hypothetical protein
MLGGEDRTATTVRGDVYLLLIIDVTMHGNGTLLRGRLAAVTFHVAPLRGTVVGV